MVFLDKVFTVAHWNMGLKYWQRITLEAEAVTLQYKPDIFIISESNLIEELSEQERSIPGYTLLLPKTTELQRVARLVILLKYEVQIEVKNEYMDNSVCCNLGEYKGEG